MKNNNKNIRHYILMGIYFGYPNCCIIDFLTRERNGLQVTQEGFCLCSIHGKQVINKEIKIEKLIIDRICKYKFPRYDSHIWRNGNAEISFSSKQLKRYNKIKRILNRMPKTGKLIPIHQSIHKKPKHICTKCKANHKIYFKKH